MVRRYPLKCDKKMSSSVSKWEPTPPFHRFHLAQVSQAKSVIIDVISLTVFKGDGAGVWGVGEGCMSLALPDHSMPFCLSEAQLFSLQYWPRLHVRAGNMVLV